MSKLDKQLWKETMLEAHVQASLDVMISKHKSNSWDKFIRTEGWVYIFENTNEFTQRKYKGKWYQLIMEGKDANNKVG